MASPLDDLNRPVTGNAPEPTDDPADVIAPDLAETIEPEPTQQQAPEIPSGDLRNEANNRWDQFRERIKNSQKKLKGDVGGSPTAQATEQVGKKAVQSVEKQAVKKVAATAGRQVASKAATSVAVAAAPEIGAGILVAVGVGLVVIIILVIIFAIFGIGGSGSGGGLPQYPSTATQREQATLLAALSGDSVANNKTVAEVIRKEKERYDRIKTNAQKYSPSEVAAIDQKITEFTPMLDSILSVPDKVGRKKIKDDLQAKMVAFEQTLPFGLWIAEIAKTRVGDRNSEFCTITDAPANLACASFSSTTLWDAGVPNAIVGTTTALWNNKSLRLVIDRAATASNDRIDESVMRPGDVVWFGHGAQGKKRYAGALFDHVGIYIGNGQIVDSSSKLVIQQRKLTTHRFNGAKRYGKD